MATYEAGPLELQDLHKAIDAAKEYMQRNNIRPSREGQEYEHAETLAKFARDTAVLIVEGNRRLLEYQEFLNRLERFGGNEWDVGTGERFNWASPAHQTLLMIRRLINEDPYSPLRIYNQIVLAESALQRVGGTPSLAERHNAFFDILGPKAPDVDSILTADPNVGPGYLNQMVY